MSIQSVRLVLFVTLLSFTISSCVIKDPVTGKKTVTLVSESQEQAMGDEYNPQVLAQFGVYEDKAMQAFIEREGQAMARVSHRPNLKYQFKVVDSHVVNAFAVPGGYVYFTRGIMAHFNNEAEFAGVLGHEIGHITARHSAKQQSKQKLASGLLMGGMVFSETVRQYGEAASQSLGLLFLKFSRDNESQSDELGVEYSTAVGYNSHEMANFFQTISRLSGASGQSVPDFMSTHPNPDNRFARVHQLSDNIQTKIADKSKLKVNRASYLRMIEGLVYGEDPRQGFVESGVFYHPELKFQFPVPANWKHQNSPIQFQMASEDGKGMMVLSAGPGTLQEVKTAMITQYKLTEKASKNVNVNGLTGLEFEAVQVPAQQEGQAAQPSTHLLVTLIEYGGLVYKLLGVAAEPDYATNTRYFRSTMDNFRALTDRDKLNRQPERIRIKTLSKTTTLQQALASYNMPSTRLTELSILNGMEATTQVKAGSMIKIVGQ